VSLLTLAETKLHLNIPAGNTTYDGELQGFIDAAQPVVEDLAGPVVQRTIVGETHDGGDTMIRTLYAPVISVQSLVEYVGTSAFTLTAQPLGSTTNNYGYEVVDSIGGVIVRRGSAGVPIAFQAGQEGVVISYTAGYATLPANVRLGALELVRHWWQRSQQGGRPSFSGAGEGGDGGVSVGSYLVPYFVAELLTSTPSSTRRLPGIA
jgi:hypothetical protein